MANEDTNPTPATATTAQTPEGWLTPEPSDDGPHTIDDATIKTTTPIPRTPSIRKGLITTALVGPCLMGLALIPLSQTTLDTRLAALFALLLAAPAVAVCAKQTLLAPYRKLLEDLDALESRIRAISAHDRSMQFDSLLAIDEVHPLAPVSLAVHSALVGAHRARMKAARLERDMDHTISNNTRKETARLTRLSTTDELTKLLNRRGFDQQLETLFNHAIEQGESLTLLTIDLDKFKPLNDNFGHAAGDKALAALGEIIRATLRDHDIAGRTGGDEFVMILPRSSEADAKAAYTRIAHLFKDHPAAKAFPNDWPTLSAGIASRRTHPTADHHALLDAADQSLYHSKKQGRNTVSTLGRTAA